MAWVSTDSASRRDANRQRAQIEDWLDTCEAAASVDPSRGGTRFSDWEREFLESIREQFDDGRNFSERQTEVLRGLYDRV